MAFGAFGLDENIREIKKLRREDKVYHGRDSDYVNGQGKATDRKRAMDFWRENTNMPSPERVASLSEKFNDDYSLQQFLRNLDFNARQQQQQSYNDVVFENKDSNEDDPLGVRTPLYDGVNVRDKVRKNDFNNLEKIIDEHGGKGRDLNNALFSELASRSTRFKDTIREEGNNFGYKPNDSGVKKAIRENHNLFSFGTTDGVDRKTDSQNQEAIDKYVENRKVQEKFKELTGLDHEEFFGRMPLMPSKAARDAARLQQIEALESTTGIERNTTDYKELRDQLGELSYRANEEFKRRFDNEDVWVSPIKDSKGKWHATPMTKRKDGAVYVVQPEKDGEERYIKATDYYGAIEEDYRVSDARTEAETKWDAIYDRFKSGDKKALQEFRELVHPYISSKDKSREDDKYFGGSANWKMDKNYSPEFLSKLKKEDFVNIVAFSERKHIGAEKKAAFVLEPFDRTISTTANMFEQWAKLDDDNRQKGEGIGIPFTGLELEDLGLTSYDDFIKNPVGGVKSLAKGAKEGFWNVNPGEGWVGGNKSLSFKDALRHNAERNPDRTTGDNRLFQSIAGFAGDLVLDPLNFVGVGFIDNGAAAARGLKVAGKSKTENILSDIDPEVFDEFANTRMPKDVLREHGVDVQNFELSDGDFLTGQDLMAVMGGNVPRRYNSPAQRREFMDRAHRTLSAMESHTLKGADETFSSRRDLALARQEYQELSRLARAAKTQRDALVAEEITSVHLDSFSRMLSDGVAKGDIPQDVADAVKTSVAHGRISDALESHSLHKFHDPDSNMPFSHFVGKGLSKHPAFGKNFDFDKLVDDVESQLTRQDADFSKSFNSNKGKALKAQLEAARKEHGLQGSTESAARVKSAQKAYETYWNGRRAALVPAIQSAVKNRVHGYMNDLPTDYIDAEKHLALQELARRAADLQLRADGQGKGTRNYDAATPEEQELFDGINLDDLTLDNIDDFLDPEKMGFVHRDSLLDALVGDTLGQDARIHGGGETKSLHREGAIAKAMQKNSSPVGDLTSWDKLVTPEVFKTDQFIADVFDFDPSPKSQRVFFQPKEFEKVAGRPPTPEETAWARQVAAEATVRGKVLVGERSTRNTARRNRRSLIERKASDEALIKASAKAQINPNTPYREQLHIWNKITHRFTNNKGVRVIGIESPNGKVVEWSTSPARIKKQFKDSGIEIPKNLVEESRRIKATLETMKNAKTKDAFDFDFNTHVPKGYQFKQFAFRLTEAGIAVPHNREAMQAFLWKEIQSKAAHLKANRLFDQAALEPEHFMFNQVFKEQTRPLIQKMSGGRKNYGLSVQQAKTTEQFLKDSPSVAMNDPKNTFPEAREWRRRFKVGVSEQDFMRLATSEPQTLANLLKGGPFRRLKFGNHQDLEHFVAPVLGDKENLAAKYTEFADDFHSFLLENPEDALKALQDEWGRVSKASAFKNQQKVQRKSAVLEASREKVRADVADEVDSKFDFKAMEKELPSIHVEALTEAVNKARRGSMAAREFPDLTMPAKVSRIDDAVKEARRVHDAMQVALKSKADGIKSELKLVPKTDIAKIAQLDAELEAIQKTMRDTKHNFIASKTQARETRKALLENLYEESVRKLANRAVAKHRHGLEVRLGKSFVVPMPEGLSTMRKGQAAQNSQAALNEYRNGYRRYFQDSIHAELKAMREAFEPMFTKKSGFHDEAQLWMNRATNNTSQVIRYNLERLKRTVGKHTTEQRILAFREMSSKGVDRTDDVHSAILGEFDQLAKYFNGTYTIGGNSLNPWYMSRWLPDALALTEDGKKMLARAKSGKDVMRAFREGLVPEAAERAAKRNIDLDDPIHLLWKLRIAIEKNIGDTTLKLSIKDSYGMPVIPITKDMDIVTRQAAEAIQSLTARGWVGVERLGGNTGSHIFHPDVAKEINKMLDMLEPHNLDNVGKFIDNITGEMKIKHANWTTDPDNPTLGGMVQHGAEQFLKGFDATTGAWKMGATIYNPGYYVRNLVGEVMTGWIGGVRNPKYYSRAWKVLDVQRGADIQEALLSHQPWMVHVNRRNRAVKPKDTAVRLPDGTKLSYKDIDVLYHDQGLKTGFVNTQHDDELGLGVVPGSKSQAIGRSAVGRAHTRVRHFGEAAEDLPRIAHFMHSLENAPKGYKTLKQRASYAAAEVRKHHFDYSDVTRFEQTVIGRLLPFFKWTRKAMPLIAQTYFLKPGKIAAFPKAMDALSEANSDHFLTDEDNGNMPTYKGMIPGWIRDIGAYNIGTDLEGKDTYFNLQVPQMDAMKAFTNPMDLGNTLLNPLIKQPIQNIEGSTGGNIDLPVETMDERFDNLARLTPISNFLNKIGDRKDSVINEPGAVMDESLAALLSGLGLYENDSTVTRYGVNRTPVPQRFDLTRYNDPVYQNPDTQRPNIAGGE